MKRSLFFALFALATVALLVTGCKTVGVASARAGEVESFESGLGTINVPRLALGQVFGINRIAKRGMPIDKVKYSTKDVSSDQKIDALKIGFDSKLDISFGANIPAAVQGSFSTAIAKSTELEGKNVQRTSIYKIINLLNNDESVKASVEAYLKKNKTDQIYVVHSTVNVSSLDMSLAGGVTSKANVSTITYGNYELTVTYECSNVLSLSGAGVSAFIKAAPIAYDTVERTFYFDSSLETSLQGISMVATK